MNCKQGDIAIIVAPCVPSNLGALVEVIRPWESEKAEPNSWWVRSLGGQRLRDDGTVSMEGGVADRRLRPIRPSAASAEIRRTAEAAA